MDYLLRVWFVPLSLLSLVLGSGCGSQAPRDDQIYHDPALRPGVVEARGPERTLLVRLSQANLPRSMTIEGQEFTVEPIYDAASGRRCRAVSAGRGRRLACERPDRSWVFVPTLEGSDP